MPIISLPSPNFDSRNGEPVDMLVLHYTGMETGDAALARLCDAAAKVSAHYVVEEDGRIFQLVEESERAWHAGVSSWQGETNINARSIGIEIVNPGHEFGYRAFPETQVQAVLELCKGILSRHAIPARNVVGHSDVAPLRKADPGELFPWKFLAGEGVGLWAYVNREELAGLPLPSVHAEAFLRGYGYGFDAGDANELRAAITAFQRHFRTEEISGEWDVECETILQELLRAARA